MTHQAAVRGLDPRWHALKRNLEALEKFQPIQVDLIAEALLSSSIQLVHELMQVQMKEDDPARMN